MLYFDPSTIDNATRLLFEAPESGIAAPDSDHTILHFENVSAQRPGAAERIENISFELKQGDNLVVLGPEGSGKALFLDMITCKNKPSEGDVRFLGQTIHDKIDEELEVYRSCIAYISWNFGLVNNLSVLDNVILPMRYHTTLGEESMRERANFFLEKYHLYDKRDMRPRSLNQSEGLRVAFVRAIVNQPMLILMDHALTSQDPLALAKFLELAEDDIQKNHISFIMTTFDYANFQRYAQHYILLYDGRIVFSGNAADLEKSENEFIRQYLSHPLAGPMRSFRGD